MRSLLRAFVLLGMFRIWRYLKRNEIVILTLHGVMDRDVESRWIPLRAQYPHKYLDLALRTLCRYYRFVSLTDAVAMLDGRKPMQPNCMVLTFDDGYLNNVNEALPVLRKYEVPAVMYVVCGNVEQRQPFWFDRLDYALQHADVDGKTFVINGEDITIDASDRAALRASYKRLRRAAKKNNRCDLDMLEELSALSTRLEQQSGRALSDIFEQDSWSCVMTWQQVEELSSDPLVEIGSHTVNHVRLSQVDDERVARELLESKDTLEANGAQPCRHFCYPDGSFNHNVATLVEKAGYQSAVTTVEGMNPVATNLMTLKRIHLPHTVDPKSTLYVASGLASALAARRGKR